MRGELKEGREKEGQKSGSPVITISYYNKAKVPERFYANRDSLFIVKKGGLLLSRIALQYHRRKRA